MLDPFWQSLKEGLHRLPTYQQRVWWSISYHGLALRFAWRMPDTQAFQDWHYFYDHEILPKHGRSLYLSTKQRQQTSKRPPFQGFFDTVKPVLAELASLKGPYSKTAHDLRYTPKSLSLSDAQQPFGYAWIEPGMTGPVDRPALKASEAVLEQTLHAQLACITAAPILQGPHAQGADIAILAFGPWRSALSRHPKRPAQIHLVA